MDSDLVNKFDSEMVRRKVIIPAAFKGFIEQLLYFKDESDVTWVHRATAREQGFVPVSNVTMWRYTRILIHLGVLTLFEGASNNRSPRYLIDTDKVMGLTASAIETARRELGGALTGERKPKSSILKSTGDSSESYSEDTTIQPNETERSIKTKIARLQRENSRLEAILSLRNKLAELEKRNRELMDKVFRNKEYDGNGVESDNSNGDESHELDDCNILGKPDTVQNDTKIGFVLYSDTINNTSNKNPFCSAATLAPQTDGELQICNESQQCSSDQLNNDDEPKGAEIAKGNPLRGLAGATPPPPLPFLVESEHQFTVSPATLHNAVEPVAAQVSYVPCDDDGMPVEGRRSKIERATKSAKPKPKRKNMWETQHKDVMECIAKMRLSRPAVLEALYPGAAEQSDEELHERIAARAREFAQCDLFKITGEDATFKNVSSIKKLLAQYDIEEIYLIKKWSHKQSWIKGTIGVYGMCSFGGRGVESRYRWMMNQEMKPKNDYQLAMIMVFNPDYQERMDMIARKNNPALMGEYLKKKEEDFKNSSEGIELARRAEEIEKQKIAAKEEYDRQEREMKEARIIREAEEDAFLADYRKRFKEGRFTKEDADKATRIIILRNAPRGTTEHQRAMRMHEYDNRGFIMPKRLPTPTVIKMDKELGGEWVGANIESADIDSMIGLVVGENDA